MAQTPATLYTNHADTIDYTSSGSAVVAGDVIVLGSVVAIATHDIADGELGSLALEGVFKVPKITGVNAVGTLIYWDPAGNPVNGDAGSGAATSTAGALKQMGYVARASLSGDELVQVVLSKA
jgi:predicted RecA/RadA family phage recombinase